MIERISQKKLIPINQGEIVNDQVLLVAEQDAEGHVAAVWKVAQGERIARPMRRNDLDRESRAGANLYGGPAKAILAYIDRLPDTESSRV